MGVSFSQWVAGHFEVRNATGIPVDVYAIAEPVIQVLREAGLAFGDTGVSIKAAFDNLKATQRCSWVPLQPGEKATFPLKGGHVSVLSQQDASAGFCSHYWMRVGRKLAISGKPQPVHAKLQLPL